MKKLAGESKDIEKENLAAMQQLFPEAFEEGKIDFDVLRQLLGDYVDDEEERYSFRWNGKGKALRLSQTPSTGTLRPCKEESKDWDTTENLYIEGDNLEVLKLLQKSYHGKVKMIYIDPPYNTGKDFVYKDDFRDNVANYKRITGQIDDEGHSTGTNSESNGRFHTDWLNMMYPRLRLARNLLSDDGFIAISIGEEEIDNLKKICNEIFGEQNYRNIIAVRRYDKNLNLQFIGEGLLSMNVGLEYIYVNSKQPMTKMTAVYREATEERRNNGYWKGFWNNADRPTMRYEILGFTPIEGQWKWREEIAKEAIENYIEYGKSFAHKMTLEEYWEMTGKNKRFIRRNPNGKGKNMGVDHWIPPANGTLRNSNWSDLLVSQAAGFDIPFDSPKNMEVIQTLNNLFGIKEADIVLDFFSGSATTAHAVMNLNAEDGGNRRFILVQLPETTPVDSEAHKAGYENICEIGKERIRRAGEKIKAECEDAERAVSLDIGFKVFKLDSSNLQKWQPQPEDLQGALQESMDNFLPDRTNLDVVYEIALKLGLDLSYEVEEREVDGQTIYIIGAGALMICLASPISTETAEALLKLHEEYAPETWQVVFRDTGFLSDQEKTNIKETLKSAGLDEDAFISI